MGSNISSLRPRSSVVGALWLRLSSPALVDARSNFNRTLCASRIANNTTTGSVALLYDSDVLNPIIGLATCLKECGVHAVAYGDWVPRVNTWFLPVVVLIFSLYSSTAGECDGRFRRLKHVFLSLWIAGDAATHALGDPVHYTYCMLSRERLWRQCIQEAKEFLGVRGNAEIARVAGILYAFEWLDEHEQVINEYAWQPRTTTPGDGNDTTNITDSRSLRNAYALASPSPRNVIGTRSGSIYSTVPAIGLYIWQVAGAFVPAIGRLPILLEVELQMRCCYPG
jgi:hypothetical protein